jgi:nitric-oxide synthase
MGKHEFANKENHADTYERNDQQLLQQADAFLKVLQHHEGGISIPSRKRLKEIEAEVEQSGTYWQNEQELMYGTMIAWRNSARCIGRLHWKSLQIRDKRHITRAEDIFEAVVDHLRLATNGGKIRPMITIFAPQMPGAPGIRIWNPQLIRYAGYRQPDGIIIGDPQQVELTDVIYKLGWHKHMEGPFDILPLVIQMPGQAPQLFELPQDAVLEVPINHPQFAWFSELGIKWHALPAISDMRLEIGGISYTAAPSNGWYMCTEIGARNLGDVGRYNLLPVVARRMGLNTQSDRNLWKDRALIELNIAVLHSFSQQGVTIVDHHTTTQQFILHEKEESLVGRCTPADWGWIVPPISSSATPVFHRTYDNVILKPNFFYQLKPW